jgi:hypothetical protein
MGATAAVVSAVVGTYSVIEGAGQRKEARSNQERAQKEGEKIQSETRAQNQAAAAAERRAQIREERVRRGRIMQSAENTGTAGSSGEFGALGALSTGLGVNIGTNLGRIGSAERTSEAAQSQTNFLGAAQNNLQSAKEMDALFNLSGSIFSASGGLGTLGNIGSSGGATDFSGVNYNAIRDQ